MASKVSGIARSAVLGGAGVLAAFALVACQSLLELERPQLRPDAAPDASPDAAPVDSDVADGARTCPPAPAGCVSFHCQNSASCYYACSGTSTWYAAQSYCTQVGCLATIESYAEEQCIAAAMNPTKSSPVWIGAYQQDDASEPNEGWNWICGTSGYTGWAPFEPNDLTGDQDCAELTSGGHWNDAACGYARRFVCELP